MPRSGQYFDVELKRAHLNWGTEGASRSVYRRNEYEVYIPISMDNARRYTIRPGELFHCTSADGFFHGPLKATGSQGKLLEYGKNFHKEGDLRALGYWLKDRHNAREGDIVRVEFTGENSILLQFLRA
ncbi:MULTISPECIES: hypothetical protein [Bacillaceae]|uniref:NgoFVII family restriction endonuclease n=1 Tax=Cytobacillus oceanisediminis 2691 TaxID=1196031 RepID=A0A160MCJ5_9BACI|nr:MULTISPECIES: hypothetical protein [Bacillaceae]AND40652.1 hypothetical protein A361_16320 [Cytobacillus oceanisediminis 2691]PAE23873.1 NgoFVII family restriction endonuclease [Bacillus sp. 7894-2]QOK29145.1 hypothetical protein IIE26_10985 [Cytobacillus oceanisediminis]